MDELLTRFLEETDPIEVQTCGVQLSSRDNPDDVYALLSALKDGMEARRWGAVYALGFARTEPRAVVPLMNVLLDRTETAWVRSEAAECLGYLGYSRSLKALIRCSRDPSPDVRFWCVFGLGQFGSLGRKNLKRGGLRALEQRLTDWAWPQEKGWWPVRYEALAMLNERSSRWTKMFREEIEPVLADPAGHAHLWPWASCYAHDVSDQAEKQAIVKIIAAGLDPRTLGRPYLDQTPKAPDAMPGASSEAT
jgi:hypothetical protein